MADYNPQVDDLFEDEKPEVDKALNLIVSSIADIKTIGVTDADLERFLSNTLGTPFNDAGKSLAKKFQPDTSDVPAEDKAMAPAIQRSAEQITAGMSSPYAPILNQSASPLGDDKVLNSQNVSPGSFDFVKNVFDQTKLAMRSMFISGADNESNMAGLFLLAVEEIEPLIDAEIENLVRMKRLVYQIIEQTSNLPATFVPEIPNVAVIHKLCAAEQDLGKVEFELQQFATFNQAGFADAANEVCGARTILKSGLVPEDLREKVKNLFNLSDLQFNAILQTRLSPDPLYKHSLIELTQLNSFVQETDPRILEVHNNILDVVDVMVNVQDIGIGKILVLIIDSIRRQIEIIRGNLEDQTRALVAASNAARDRIVAGGRVLTNSNAEIDFTFKPGQKTALSSQELTYNQTLVYAQLSALCFIMQRAQKMYFNVQGLLSGQSKVIDAIKDFATQYAQNKCGDPNGARYIDTAVSHFVNAAETRLGGSKESNEIVAKSGQDLIKRLSNHIRFLKCLRGTHSLGQQGLGNKLSHALGGPSKVFQAKNVLFGLARSVPEMAATLKQLDLRKILGIEKTEYSGLDKLQHGLSMLIQLCPEQTTRYVAREFQDRFEVEFARRKSSAVTMGSLEEVPSVALHVAIKQRVDGVKRLVEQLKQFTQIDIKDLCAKGGAGLPTLEGSTKAAGVFVSDLEPNSRGGKIQTEQQDGQDAAGQVTPFRTA